MGGFRVDGFHELFLHALNIIQVLIEEDQIVLPIGAESLELVEGSFA